jgi:PAS domain S-box-containing protein
MTLGLRAPANLQSPETGRAGRSPLLTDAVQVLLVGAAYFLAAKLSLRLALVESNVTPLWPPTGIAVVAYLMLGRKVWPGIFAAAFLVNLPISPNLIGAATTAVGNTLAPFVAAAVLEWAGFHKEIDRLRDAMVIVAAALSSMLISASIGTVTLVVEGAIAGHSFLSAWAVWWAGDTMGVLVVAPFLLIARSYGALRSWSRRAELVVLLGAITAVAFFVTRSDLRIMFLTLPLLGLAAWRFQQLGAAPGALLVAGIAAWAAARGMGPFETGTLFQKMLNLQAFNATVAFTSFVFAAVVSERIRAREELELAARELETRVQRRTAELSGTNRRLEVEISERRNTERALRDRERQLGEAQEVAHIGSWEWVIPEDRVAWSDEMFRIHGHPPQAFPVTFTRAVEQVNEEDAALIRENVEAALQAGQDHVLPDIEYRIHRPDGTERVLLGKARLSVDPAGTPARMIGIVQDITEGKQAQREHLIAETLQRSLLPDGLPEIPGIVLVARYVPGTDGMEVGGDWYDVVELPDGRLCLAVGDVVGHGLRAASTMGQLRMALRAYALRDPSPALVLRKLHQMVDELALTEMATVVYLVFDPISGSLRYSNAGHPPPLVVGQKGEATYLDEALGPPLGAVRHFDEFGEAEAEFGLGATLLLYTDGLVERRGESISTGLDHLVAEARAAGGQDVEALCDHLLASMLGPKILDDVAILCLRHQPIGGQPLRLSVPAEPAMLSPIRQTVRRWLGEVGADKQESYEILVACGEACANAIQHAYGAGEGRLDLELSLVRRAVEVVIRDSGTWRPPVGGEWGRGLGLMRGLMDNAEIEHVNGGTTVRMRRLLGARL